MHEYKVFGCYIFCGFVIGVSLANSFSIKEIHAARTHRYLVPDWPSIVDSDKIHVWIITAATPGPRVRINAYNFAFKDKGNNSFCPEYLQINDGRNPNENILGRYCGRVGPYIISSGPSLTIVYRPDGNFHGTFNLEYRAVEDHPIPAYSDISLEADSYERVFESPGYPLNYYNLLYYVWRIVSRYGGRVKVEILSVDLEKDGISFQDYLQFFNGNSTDAPSLGVVNSEEDGRVFTSSGRYLTVLFHSNDVYVGKGFQIQYEESPVKDCSFERLTAQNMVTSYLTSPGYPGYNQVFQNCTWNISTSNLYMHVRVKILRLEMEPSYGCLTDYLVIYDAGRQSTEIGRVCTNQSATLLTFDSTSTRMTIRYQTHGRVPSMFQLHYTAAWNNEINLISEDAYIIPSPNYPDLYPNNADEWWGIHSPIGIVNMVSLDFSLEYTPGCNYDYLEAYDGYDEHSPFLGRWCGEDRVSASSTGVFMYVKFHSDEINQKSGFKLSFTASRKPTTLSPENEFPEGGISTAAVIGSILGVVGVVLIAGCFACYTKHRSKSHTRNRQNDNANTRQVYVVGDPVSITMSPPDYSEVVKDGPPSYFEVIQGDSGHLVTISDEREGQGVDNPALLQETTEI